MVVAERDGPQGEPETVGSHQGQPTGLDSKQHTGKNGASVVRRSGENHLLDSGLQDGAIDFK